MISRNYDVVVVQPSPGALVAAALLARAGLSVLVLDERGKVPPVGRFRFAQHRPPILGFGSGLLLPRSLRALKFHPHELQSVRRSTPGLQVITSRTRMDLHNDPAALEAELRREYPGDAEVLATVIRRATASARSFAEALERAVEDAGQTGFLHNLGLARPDWNPPLPPEDLPTWGTFLDNAGLGEAGRTLLHAMLRPFCALDVLEDLPVPVAGLHLAAALDGCYSDASEEDPMLALLLRRVQAMRVDVLPERLEGLEGNRRKIEAAHLSSKAEEMPIQFLLTGGDPEGIVHLLPGGERPYERVLGRLAPSHFRYSIYLGVRGKVIPPDLADSALLVDDSRPTGSPGDVMLLSTTSAGSPLAPEGHRSMTVSTVLPYADDGSIPDDLEAVAGGMLDRVKWLLPYLERHIEVLQVPTGVDPTDDDPMTVDPAPVAFTPAIPPVDDPVAAGLGVTMPHRNLYCVGPSAFPALGLGGEALAGRLVERLALASRKPERG